MRITNHLREATRVRLPAVSDRGRRHRRSAVALCNCAWRADSTKSCLSPAKHNDTACCSLIALVGFLGYLLRARNLKQPLRGREGWKNKSDEMSDCNTFALFNCWVTVSYESHLTFYEYVFFRPLANNDFTAGKPFVFGGDSSGLFRAAARAELMKDAWFMCVDLCLFIFNYLEIKIISHLTAAVTVLKLKFSINDGFHRSDMTATV